MVPSVTMPSPSTTTTPRPDVGFPGRPVRMGAGLVNNTNNFRGTLCELVVLDFALDSTTSPSLAQMSAYFREKWALEGF